LIAVQPRRPIPPACNADQESEMKNGFTRADHGKRWDETADAELRDRVARGQYLPEIAAGMGRTQEAVRSRANLLKLPVRSSARRGEVRSPTLP
jgi:hypothetical protein